MMRKIVSVLLAAALLALCAGCQETAEEPSVPELPPEEEEIVTPEESPEPVENFTLPMPDGGTADTADALERRVIAADNKEGFLFDFAFLRYRQPVYETTITRPDLVNMETLEFAEDAPEELEDVTYFRVQAGDVLENGLTVESADFWCYDGRSENGYEGTCCSSSSIHLTGPLTLEGMLIGFPDDDGYIDLKGDLLFYPDSTTNPFIPAPLTQDGSGTIFTRQVTDGRIGLVSDGHFRLGNREEVKVDVSSVLPTDGQFVWVRVTLDNIWLFYREMTSGAYTVAEIVELEELSAIEEPSAE